MSIVALNFATYVNKRVFCALCVWIAKCCSYIQKLYPINNCGASLMFMDHVDNDDNRDQNKQTKIYEYYNDE